MRKSKLILLALLLIAGCTKEKRSAISNNAITSSPGATNFSSLQADIFALSCAVSGCHDNRATPAGNLNLSSVDKSHAALVNVASSQVPSKKLVSPNGPSASYLIGKLDGTYTAMGGNGVRMPQYAAALSTEDIDRIITWINNGAPKD
jgi:cytochrome c553